MLRSGEGSPEHYNAPLGVIHSQHVGRMDGTLRSEFERALCKTKDEGEWKREICKVFQEIIQY